MGMLAGQIYDTGAQQAAEARRPVPPGPGRRERTIDRVTDVISRFDADVYPTRDFIPPRYCWPPAR
jgi:hypothetical protein